MYKCCFGFACLVILTWEFMGAAEIVWCNCPVIKRVLSFNGVCLFSWF